MPPCLPEGRQWEAEWPEKGTSVDVEVVVEFEGELALGVGGADDPAGRLRALDLRISAMTKVSQPGLTRPEFRGDSEVG